jgi:hypothetical protein
MTRSESPKTWDVFLSHAGEDKPTLVRPLADRLTNLGLKVAYDEFTFRLGESLVASIDQGIANSGAGVLILSEAFFIKPWPQHEKNGLLNRLVTSAEDFLLIPVWHGVTRDQVASFSPTIADRLAIDTTGLSVEEVALKLVERIRPDIFTALLRRLEFERRRADPDRIEYVPISELKYGPIRHETLPTGYVNRLRVIAEVFRDVSDIRLPELLDLYQRELYPDIELRVWERMAACYREICEGLAKDDPIRKKVYSTLLSLTMSEEGGAKAVMKLDSPVRERMIASIFYTPPWEPSDGGRS